MRRKVIIGYDGLPKEEEDMKICSLLYALKYNYVIILHSPFDIGSIQFLEFKLTLSDSSSDNDSLAGLI